MYIKKINKFLESYENMEENKFLEILKFSNKKKFDNYKIEKDFLLTLVLIKFGEKYPDLIFKGGTCLNKIYFPYFRLSEDLDFVLESDLGEKGRKNLLKKYENEFIKDLDILGIKLREERTKFNSYKLAMFNFEYKSIINNSTQTIKIDISFKDKLQLRPVSGKIKAVFQDAFLEEDIFGNHFINCINLKESIAEKLRASLTRMTPAIRDFFDIWYIKKHSNFDFMNDDFINLVKIKLEEADCIYTLEDNYDLLEKQIETDLKPVLNDDFEFNLEEIFNFVLTFKIKK